MKQKILKISLWIAGILLGISLMISGGLYFFKDEICAFVIQEVNQHLKAKVKVQEVDLSFWGSFPNVSVDFNEVFIQDSYEDANEYDTLLYTERVRLKFNASDIWNEIYDVKEIELFPGSLQIKIDSSGVSNYDILKTTADTTSNSNFNLTLEKVNLNEVRFQFKNLASNQYYSTYIYELELEGAFSEKEYTLHSKSKLFVNQIKSGNVALINNKSANFDLNILVNQEQGFFEIPKAKIYIANLPFNLDGKVTDKDLYFHISANQLELKDVANNFTLSTIEDLKKFSGTGTVKFDATIKGEVASNKPPEVNCDFSIANGQLIEPSLDLKISKISLNGKYTNKGGASKEYLKLSNVAFNTVGGPFVGNLLVTKFNAPILKGNAKGNLDLAILHRLFSFPSLESTLGNISLNSKFEIQSILQANQTYRFNAKQIEGNVALKNVSLQLKEDKRLFEKLNGNIYLRDKQIGVEELQLKVGKTDLLINGVFDNIFNYLNQKSELNADVVINSNFIDIQDLSTETKEEQISDGKDWILPNDIIGSISLNAKEIKYETHSFKKLKTDLKVSERTLNFNHLQLENAEALITGNLLIEERTPETFTITTTIKSSDIDLKAMFKEWNNFEQDVIQAKNVDGKIAVNLFFSAPFSLESGIIKNAIESTIDLKIDNGRLINLSSFQEISKSLRSSSARLVISKRTAEELEKKLLNLQFETLSNTLKIKNGQIEIPKMTIKSNALDVNLYGKHGFNDIVDYHFSFRFREIKTVKNDQEFGTIEDDESGVKIFLQMFGNIDDPSFKWDKDAKKAEAKENREQAKKDAKSILKTEFGLFKGDSSVNEYEEIKKPKETIKVYQTKEEEKVPEKEKKKETKIGNTLKKWKQQAEEENKVQFEVD